MLQDVVWCGVVWCGARPPPPEKKKTNKLIYRHQNTEMD